MCIRDRTNIGTSTLVKGKRYGHFEIHPKNHDQVYYIANQYVTCFDDSYHQNRCHPIFDPRKKNIDTRIKSSPFHKLIRKFTNISCHFDNEATKKNLAQEMLYFLLNSDHQRADYAKIINKYKLQENCGKNYLKLLEGSSENQNIYIVKDHLRKNISRFSNIFLLEGASAHLILDGFSMMYYVPSDKITCESEYGGCIEFSKEDVSNESSRI